jgi:TPR repeat protein
VAAYTQQGWGGQAAKRQEINGLTQPALLRVILIHVRVPVESYYQKSGAPLTLHTLPHPGAAPDNRPWRAELLASLSPRELTAAFEGEDPADWLHAAMVSGMAQAQIRMGRMLLAGEGLPTDHRAAFACFLSAAASGDPEGQNLLGRCHDNGWGTLPNKDAARRCYKAAAEGGDYRGAHNHACALASDGCIAGALHWFEKAVKDAPPPARDAILIALSHHPRCAIRAFARRGAI